VHNEYIITTALSHIWCIYTRDTRRSTPWFIKTSNFHVFTTDLRRTGKMYFILIHNLFVSVKACYNAFIFDKVFMK